MILGILQARVSSSRLPGKVLKPILGEPMLLRQIERLLRIESLDKLLVATSVNSSDDPIQELCLKNNVECFRGSLDDVLDRFYQAATQYQPKYVMRFTGDCPLADPQIADRLISLHLQGGFDCTANAVTPTFPDGLDMEIMCYPALEKAWCNANLPSYREHVTLYIYQHPKDFMIGSLENLENLSYMRWTVDEQEDFDLIVKVYEALYPNNPNFLMQDILDFSSANPELANINNKILRNEGLLKSLCKDKLFIEEMTKQNE